MVERVRNEMAISPDAGPIERAVPRSLRPFVALARLDKPTGVWLLLWPCLWSVALAPDGLPDLGLLVLFTAGAFVMRAAGCTYNDIVDRDFDAKVERTRWRPLPSGAIGLKGAVIFMAALLLAGLAILLHLNWFTVVLGVASLALVFTYPLMKRITYWPQAFLGLTFNYGALMGWAAVHGSVGWPAGLLYVAGIAWTLGYDTIYAHQDKEDDVLIGVKSSALALGTNTRPWLVGFYAVTIGGFAGAGILAAIPWPYFVGVALAAGLLGWQAFWVKIDDSTDCLAKFKANGWVGLALFTGILAAQALR
jgi:4-hydroxybenzoate polyprenyltransferase